VIVDAHLDIGWNAIAHGRGFPGRPAKGYVVSRSALERARVGLVAVAPTPKFAAEASQSLAGKPATEETFARAGELAKRVASPISDLRGTAEFRLHLVGVLTKRTLAKAVERARG